jgi:hypothetical protein
MKLSEVNVVDHNQYLLTNIKVKIIYEQALQWTTFKKWHCFTKTRMQNISMKSYIYIWKNDRCHNISPPVFRVSKALSPN